MGFIALDLARRASSFDFRFRSPRNAPPPGQRTISRCVRDAGRSRGGVCRYVSLRTSWLWIGYSAKPLGFIYSANARHYAFRSRQGLSSLPKSFGLDFARGRMVGVHNACRNAVGSCGMGNRSRNAFMSMVARFLVDQTNPQASDRAGGPGVVGCTGRVKMPLQCKPEGTPPAEYL